MDGEQVQTSAGPLAVPEISERTRWHTFILCLLGWLFDHYDMMLFVFIAGSIAKDPAWAWEEDEFTRNKSFLIGIAMFMSGVGGVVCGGLADRYGRKRVMGWTILMYSLFTGLSGLAVGLISLAFFRALTGFGFGGEWASGHALLAEIFPKHRRGVASALLSAGQPIGTMLAILTGYLLAGHVHWRYLFFLGAAPALIVVFLRRWVPESPMWLARQQAKLDSPKETWAADSWGSFFKEFLEPYRVLLCYHWQPALQAFVLGASKIATYWLVIAWLPDYFKELKMLHPEITPSDFQSIELWLQVWVQISLFAGMLLFGPLADQVGRRPTFTFYALMMAMGFFALGFFGSVMLENTSLFWLAMTVIGLGSGCTAGFGALLAELFPTSIRNTAMGTVFNLSRSFQLVAQWLLATLVIWGGFSTAMLLALGFALLTATWVWTLPETKGIALQHE